MDISASQSATIQSYIGVWLARNCNQNSYVLIESALRDIFNSFEIFAEYDKCIMDISEPRPAKIFFIVSHDIGQNLVSLMLGGNTSQIEYIFIVSTSKNKIVAIPENLRKFEVDISMLNL
jgi:hypothetical protein